MWFKSESHIQTELAKVKRQSERANLINNGNRTEWSPIRFVILQVINKMELDDSKFYYQLIIAVTKFEKNVGKAKPVDDLLRFVITVMKSDFETDISRNTRQI